MTSPEPAPFSFKQALIEELGRSLALSRVVAVKARQEGCGGIVCATCSRSISPNKLQCLACSEMSEFLVLVLARGVVSAEKWNPEAEARITELRSQFLDAPKRDSLTQFAYRLAHVKHPSEVMISDAVTVVNEYLKCSL